jgi:hypothetical protein
MLQKSCIHKFKIQSHNKPGVFTVSHARLLSIQLPMSARKSNEILERATDSVPPAIHHTMAEEVQLDHVL